MNIATKAIVIKAKLQDDDEFLKRCVIKLHRHQEIDEQAAKATMHQNGVGFNKADGTYLSEMAVAYKASRDLLDSEVNKQLPEVRRRMLKYAGQLAGILSDNEL